MGYFLLDLRGKMGYFRRMSSIAYFVLRILLIATIWASVWRFVEPKTQLMRVLRAALLVLCLLGAMAVIKITDG